MIVYVDDTKINHSDEIIEKIQKNEKPSEKSKELILSLTNQLSLIAVQPIIANETIEKLSATDPDRNYIQMGFSSDSTTAPKDVIHCSIAETHSMIRFEGVVSLLEMLESGEIREEKKEIPYQCAIEIPHDGSDVAKETRLSYSYRII